MDIKSKITLDHLYIKYGKDIFNQWVKSLSIFRFCTAYPYPNDMDPDRFLAVINYSTEKAYENILFKLNMKNAPNKSSNSQFRKYTEWSYAGWQLVNGVMCYIDVSKVHKAISLVVSGTNNDQFEIDESTYQRAKNIEEFIKPLGFHFNEPPQDDNYCVCPKYYQLLWNK